jgi:hypothetical protein
MELKPEPHKNCPVPQYWFKIVSVVTTGMLLINQILFRDKRKMLTNNVNMMQIELNKICHR